MCYNCSKVGIYQIYLHQQNNINICSSLQLILAAKMTGPGSVLITCKLFSASLLQSLLALLLLCYSIQTHPSVSFHLRIMSFQETQKTTPKQTKKLQFWFMKCSLCLFAEKILGWNKLSCQHSRHSFSKKFTFTHFLFPCQSKLVKCREPTGGMHHNQKQNNQ